MLGEAGFGQRHIVNVEERGAIPTLPLHEFREDADTRTRSDGANSTPGTVICDKGG
jgi:hypothetical protein